MLTNFLGYLALAGWIAALAGVATVFIKHFIAKGRMAAMKKEIDDLKAKVVQYHQFAKTLYANLQLLKYYEQVDIQTQIEIDRISDDINEFVPIYNEFVKELKKREEDESNVAKKEEKED
jgi:Tfp pilus assembly protein PilN